MYPDKRNARTCWGTAEDTALRKAVARLGAQKWAAVAEEPGLEGRPPKSCRLRWLNHLAPAVRKERFRESETRAVALGYVRHGPRWAHIAREINGRTDSAIKNHWNNHLRQRFIRTLNNLLETPMVSDIRAAAAFGVGPEMLKKAIFSHASKSTELGGNHGKEEPQNDEIDINGTETMENNGTEITENDRTENIEMDKNYGAEICDWVDPLCTNPNAGFIEDDGPLINVSKEFSLQDEFRGETSEVQGDFYCRNDNNAFFSSGFVDKIPSIFENDDAKTTPPLRSWGDFRLFGIKNPSVGTPSFSRNSSFRLPNEVKHLISEEDELQQLHCVTTSCPELVTSGSFSSSGTTLCPQTSVDSIQSRSVQYLNSVDTASLNTLESLFLPRIRRNFDHPRNGTGKTTSESSKFPLMSTENQIFHTVRSLDCNTNLEGFENWLTGNSYNNNINSHSHGGNNSDDNNDDNTTVTSNDKHSNTLGNNNNNNLNREERTVFHNKNETSLLNSCVPCFKDSGDGVIEVDPMNTNLLEVPFQNRPKHPIPERFGTDSYTENSVENEMRDWTQLTDTVRKVFGSSSEMARQVFESWQTGEGGKGGEDEKEELERRRSR